MHDSRTVGQGHVGVAHHVVCLLVLLLAEGHGAVEQRLVLLKLQVLALVGLQNLEVLPQHGFGQGLGQIIGVAVPGFHLHIVLVGVHAQSQIAGQRPGRGGPCQDVGVLALHLEAGDGGALLHVLVALGHLVGGQRGAAARAVGHHLEALVQKALVPNLL